MVERKEPRGDMTDHIQVPGWVSVSCVGSDCVGVDSSRFMAWRGRSCVTSGMGCGGVLDWEGETSTS